RSVARLLALLLAAAPLAAQLAPPTTGGIATLDRALQQLGEDRRVLVIGAHPDDEDTRLLAVLSQGWGVRAAYLALTRGEGGQNLIGDELGVPLGLVRSRELEAARGVDGAEQFFTRAYDFGYTRSLVESQRLWPPDSILKDAVRVVRRFRPHVIVTVFSPTSRRGHGQHQMAGVVARRVYDAAGDPARFPELEYHEGLEPWTPLKLYRATRFDRDAATLTLPTGGIDPRTGRTYHQLAGESRSQHRSQAFGVAQPTGPATTSVGLLASRVEGGEGGLFAGIRGGAPWLARFADSVRAAVSPVTMHEAVAPLAAALRRAREERLPMQRRALLVEAIAAAGGLVVDGRTDVAALVAGSTVEVTVEFYNGGPDSVAIDPPGLEAPDGWSTDTTTVGRVVAPGEAVSATFRVSVPPGAPPTQPYFLVRGLDGAVYDWSATPAQVRGLPFDPPLLTARVVVYVDGAAVPIRREVTYRSIDQALGEVRRPVRVVPPVEVRLAPDRLVWSSADGDPRTFRVTLAWNGEVSVTGEVALEIDGWPAVALQSFAMDGDVRSVVREFRVARPERFTRGMVEVRAVAHTPDGRQYDAAVNVVGYPHIAPTPYVVEARSTVRVAPVMLPPLARIGYVRGASDRVPEALMAVGLPIELIDAAALADADLSVYDAIVIGARAYEADRALVEHNDRVLAYVRDGGHLVVQYQQYQFVRGGYAPYPLDISRPHDRITDEHAPVTVLDPGHPAFHTPHEIGPEDWDGWPQERGLYFAGDWDEAYMPLLEMRDPELAPVRGGLLVADYGEGTYVYTGISFFRSLPAGVPGAVRVFLNLLALGGE
ncbi:MAG: PIG-L family deacetylase, partial [Gemmatimonadales bacterium]